VDVDHDQLDPMVADISEKLDSMDREELIKRFVSLEFNRVLTVTIKVAPGYSSPNRPKQGGMCNHKRQKAA
jgi:ATP-dependent RNA helicase DeaD